MSEAGKTTKDLMGFVWSFEPNALGSFSHETLQTAACIEAAKSMARAEASLLRIEQQMRSLGADGIHDLVRLQLKEVRAKAKTRRAKAKTKKVVTT